MRGPRIVYLALAEGRGHLTRAAMVSDLLRDHADLRIFTTSPSGVAYLRAFGVDAACLPGAYRLVFDDRHAFDVAKSRSLFFEYLTSPRLLSDRAILRRERGDLYLNDSFHPALLLPSSRRSILVHAEHMAAAVAEVVGKGDDLASRASAAILSHVLGRRDALVVTADPRAHRALEATERCLPALLPEARTSVEEVRARARVPDGGKLAAIYLNPHFSDSCVAEAIERALSPEWRLHCVGEGLTGRSGWKTIDPDLASVVRAADLFVSGAGLGALALARTHGTPLLALLGDQPEQKMNTRAAEKALGSAFLALPIDEPQTLARRIREGSKRLERCPSSGGAPAGAHDRALWRDTLLALAA